MGTNKTKRLLGLILLLLGVSLFVLSLFSVARSETAIDISFVLEPGEKYEPPENGTGHHTKVLGKSTLVGEVIVQGAGVNFSAIGFNTQHLQNIFVNQNYSFVIDPADDLYSFTFDNTGGDTQSLVRFTLEERWMSIIMLLVHACGFMGLLILAPAGLILFFLSLLKRPSARVKNPIV